MNKDYLYTSDDKKSWWGDGEWVNEPDLVTFEHNGIDCKIIRKAFRQNDGHVFGGYFCGYIKVPETHLWHGESFHIDVNIHGGITYGEPEEDGYWIGFDCSHSCDVTPSMINFMKKVREDFDIKYRDSTRRIARMFQAVYRDIDYVIEECKKLADQCVEVKK